MDELNNYKLIVGLPRGTLIDIETTGLNPYTSEIITFGYITRNSLIIHQCLSSSIKDFYNELKVKVKSLSQPFYAYNAPFKKGFISSQLGFEANYIDLMDPWRIKAEEMGIKWPQLDELIAEPETYFDGPNIHGMDVPILWNQFLNDGNFIHLQKIVRHNRINLLRTLILLIHYSFHLISQNELKKQKKSIPLLEGSE